MICIFKNTAKKKQLIETNGEYILDNICTYGMITEGLNDEFTLNVNATALVDEVTVSKDLYDIVMLSLDLMGKEEKVNFEIEGETLMVEGIYDEGSVPVSSIYYNETQI